MRIKPEEFKEWNERMVRKYDPDGLHHHPNPFISFVERKRVNAILKFLNCVEGETILEIGCGAGNILEKIPKTKLFGVDLSLFILNKAKKKLKGMAFLFQGDAQNLPCKDKIFSRIICSEVLEHLIDPLDALQEMKRVLKPYGIAIVSVPNEFLINRIKRILIQLKIFHWFSKRVGEYQDIPERMDDEWHLHVYYLDGWLKLIKKFFKVRSIRRVPFFWLPIRFVILIERLK